MGALSSAQDEDWVAVMGPLYELAKNASPGSLEEQTAEKALDYAITALAEDPQGFSRSAAFAIHDHLRNARHNIARARKREAIALQKLITASTGSGALRVYGPVETRGPEEDALASDLVRHLRVSVCRHESARTVLDGVLRGLPTTSISAASRVPVRSVERMRARIRKATSDFNAA
jgi:hypothetical protein